MSVPEECRNALTKECFAVAPDYARKEFAVRLLYLLIGPEGLLRLQNITGQVIGAPATHLPPVPQLPPAQPPIPPTYTEPWQPGPPWPPPPPIFVYIYLFDDFNDLSTNHWSDGTVGTAYVLLVAGKVALDSGAPASLAEIAQTQTTTPPTTYVLELLQNQTLGPGRQTVQFHNGTYRLGISFYPPHTIQLTKYGGSQNYTVNNFTNIDTLWQFYVRDQNLNVYQNGDLVITGHQLEPYTLHTGATIIRVYDIGHVNIDHIKIGSP